MAPRTERLLTLLQALREHRRPVSARELAAQFGVSERTVQRDFKLLAELGAPVEGEAGVGYVLSDGYFLPPLSFSTLEADALLLGLRFVARRGDRELADAAAGALAKVVSSLDGTRAMAMRTNGLAVAPSGSGDSERIGRVRRAIAGEHKLQITYRDGAGVETRRVVWPIALAFFDDTEMLVAWCEQREAFRHFRLDRIQAMEERAEGLPAPRRILLAEYRLEEQDADL